MEIIRRGDAPLTVAEERALEKQAEREMKNLRFNLTCETCNTQFRATIYDWYADYRTSSEGFVCPNCENFISTMLLPFFQIEGKPYNSNLTPLNYKSNLRDKYLYDCRLRLLMHLVGERRRVGEARIDEMWKEHEKAREMEKLEKEQKKEPSLIKLLFQRHKNTR